MPNEVEDRLMTAIKKADARGDWQRAAQLAKALGDISRAKARALEALANG